MYILDGKAFAGLEESGQQHSETAVDECMLLANNQVIQLAYLTFAIIGLVKYGLDKHTLHSAPHALEGAPAFDPSTWAYLSNREHPVLKHCLWVLRRN